MTRTRQEEVSIISEYIKETGILSLHRFKQYCSANSIELDDIQYTFKFNAREILRNMLKEK